MIQVQRRNLRRWWKVRGRKPCSLAFRFQFLPGFRAGYFATDLRSPSALGLLDRWGRVGRSWFMAIAREPRPLCAIMHSFVEYNNDFTYKEARDCLAALWLPEGATVLGDDDDDEDDEDDGDDDVIE